MSGKRLSIANANAKKDEKGKRKGEKIPLNECEMKAVLFTSQLLLVMTVIHPYSTPKYRPHRTILYGIETEEHPQPIFPTIPQAKFLTKYQPRVIK